MKGVTELDQNTPTIFLTSSFSSSINFLVDTFVIPVIIKATITYLCFIITSRPKFPFPFYPTRFTAPSNNGFCNVRV